MCTLRCTGISPYLGKYAQFRCLTYVSVGHNEVSLVTIHVDFLHSLYRPFHSQNPAHMIHLGWPQVSFWYTQLCFHLVLVSRAATTVGAAWVLWSFKSRLNPLPPSAWPCSACGGLKNLHFSSWVIPLIGQELQVLIKQQTACLEPCIQT